MGESAGAKGRVLAVVKDIPLEKGKFYEFKVRGAEKPIFGKVVDVGVVTGMTIWAGSEGIKVHPYYKRRGLWQWASIYKIFPIDAVDEVEGGWESPEEYEQSKGIFCPTFRMRSEFLRELEKRGIEYKDRSVHVPTYEVEEMGIEEAKEIFQELLEKYGEGV